VKTYVSKNGLKCFLENSNKKIKKKGTNTRFKDLLCYVLFDDDTVQKTNIQKTRFGFFSIPCFFEIQILNK